MPETYTPFTWADGSGGGTPIIAVRLNSIESGIESMDDRMTALEDTASVVVANLQPASYTLMLTDAGKAIEMNSASATTVTVPLNSSVAFPIGTVVEVVRLGTGTVALVAASGVTIRIPVGSSLNLRAQYSTVGLRKRAGDEWVASGDLA